MVHDPCNPVPSAAIPKGLPPFRTFATTHVVGQARQAPVRQSHAITAITPIYIGCDHHHPSKNDAWRVNAVHFPAPVDVPATILMPRTNVTVATLSNALPSVIYDGAPATIPMQMPEPSGAALFLVAVLVALIASRLNTQQVTKPVAVKPVFKPAPVVRLRHRSKSIAPYCAFQVQLP